MDWKITSCGLSPSKILVSDVLIKKSDFEIDCVLPQSCKVVGTIIYTADFSAMKCKDLDGSWKAVGEQ